MNGPDSLSRASTRRHCVSRTSSWAQVPIASRPARATMRAPLSRTAAISARFTAMLLSRVMISQSRRVTSGIQPGSNVAGEAIGHASRRRLNRSPPGSPGVGHISTNLHKDLREAQNIGVDIEPDRGGPVVMAA